MEAALLHACDVNLWLTDALFFGTSPKGEVTLETLGSLFLTEALLAAPGVELYLGFVEGSPVSTSCLVETSGVAGIYWVATLESHRGRGLGEALTWASIRGGVARGCPVASLQASDMGEPVYRRMGFRTTVRYLKYGRP